jgi:hypothetical protein
MLPIKFKNGLCGELTITKFVSFVYADVEVKIFDNSDCLLQTRNFRLLEHEFLNVPNEKLCELIDDKIFKKNTIFSYFSSLFNPK